MNNMFASIFGESPDTKQAREKRDSAFQAMLSSRRQAAEKNRTDNVAMARYNALGNVITSMAQLGGWAAGGGTSGVQKYDDRQYLNAFNRAVKASDDLRNIGTAEEDYRFKLAEEDYKRRLATEDSERQQARMLERQERAAQAREERDQKLHEQKMELEEQKAAYRQQLADWKATHKVTSKTTGLSVDDRVMLKNLDAYNKYANSEAEYGRKPESFATWLSARGIDVLTVNPSAGNQSTVKSTGTATQAAPAATQTQTSTQTVNQTQTEAAPAVRGWGVLANNTPMYTPAPAVSSGQPASTGGAPATRHLGWNDSK